MTSSGPATLLSRPVRQLAEMDDYEDDSWRDSDSEDFGDCDWPDELDRKLRESLLERNRDPPGWQTCTSNGNNNDLWVEPTSEELIPPSAVTPEIASGQYATPRDGASLQRQQTQGRVPGTFRGGVPQTNSVSATPRPVRVVNWAAEACDRSWCQLADACDPVLDLDIAAPGKIVRQGALRKARLLAKRLPQSELGADDLRPKSYYRVPVRAGGVSGIEFHLSSVADSPQPKAALPIDWRSCDQAEPPPGDLRVPDDPIELPPTDLQKLWPSRLFDVKGSIAASSSSQEGLASQRIPSSDAPWLAAVSRGLQLPLGTSEVTMEISGDSLSSDSDEAAAAAEPLTLADAKCLADNDQLSFGPSTDWRKVVSISVIAGGGQTTSVTAAAQMGSAAGALAPLPVANSRTTSTNTEQSVSTTAAGASECPSALDARAALFAGFAMNPANISSAIAISRRPPPSRPLLVCRGEPQQSQSLRRPMRTQTARALLRHDAVSLAPVWHVCGCHPASAGARVASLRQCLADNARFAWQTKHPARCSRSSCQLLLGLMDVSQSSESQLVLPQHPVYAHRRQSDAATAIVTVERLAHCILVVTPQVLSALRFVTPIEIVDWLPPEVSSSPERTKKSPLASLWSQKIRWLQQPTNAIGLQFPAGCLPTGSTSPAWAVVLQAAPSGSNAGNTLQTSAEESTRVARKSHQLQQLRRIVRMKMQQKVQEHDFVCVACSCCSSSLQTEPGAAMRGVAEAAGGSAKSNSDPLERSLGGLLQSLRSCRQTATVAAMAQRQRRYPSGDRQLVSYVERILHESTSQQAALSNLLATLKGVASPPGAAQQDTPKLVDFEAVEEISTRSNFSCSQSDQFFSFHTGTTGLPDTATLASGRRTSFFGSPVKTNGIGRLGAETANNNAQSTTGGTTPSSASSSGYTGQRGRRHRTYYARRCIVRLEESAALLVHKTVSRACSLVAACPVHKDLADSGVSSNSSAATAATVQLAAISAARCQIPARLCAFERRVLARARRNRPPILQRQLDQLDPTVSSFVWWSLIPRNRGAQLSPDRFTTDWHAAGSAILRAPAPLQYDVKVAAGTQQAPVSTKEPRS